MLKFEISSKLDHIRSKLTEVLQQEVKRQAAKLDAEIITKAEKFVDAETAKREALIAAMQSASKRCPDCGQWLSTRYNAGQPHQCEAVRDRADLQTPLPSITAPDLSRLPMGPARPAPTMQGGQPRRPIILTPASPAHALAHPARYPEPRPRRNAPTGPARALALAWVCGAICGAFVGFLAATFALPS